MTYYFSLTKEEIEEKLNTYRVKLTNTVWGEFTKDKFGRVW